MRVCITGGTGYVGLCISAALIRQGYEVTLLIRKRSLPLELASRPNVRLIQCDLLDEAKVRKQLKGQDCLIHNSLIWNDDDQQPATTDFESTINLFQSAADVGTEKIIYTSSTAVHRPFKPFMTVNDPLEAYDSYAFVKGQNELLLKAIAENLDIKATIIRAGPVIGAPEFDGEKIKLHSQIAKMFSCALDNHPIVLTEEAGRQFICRRDLAKVFLAAIQAKSEPGTYLAVSENLTTWESIARQMIENLDSKSEIIPSSHQEEEKRFETRTLIDKLGLRFNSQASMKAMIESMAAEYSSGPFSL